MRPIFKNHTFYFLDCLTLEDGPERLSRSTANYANLRCVTSHKSGCPKSHPSFFHSIGTTAHCGLWPVEQCLSIFSYLPPTLSIFSVPAVEDLFPSFPGSYPSSRPFHFFSEIFLGTLSSSILSRWPNQLILCPFIHFTISSPWLISSSSRFIRLFHSPFSHLWPYILLNIFLSKISRACSSFFVNVRASTPNDTPGLISVLYNIILVALDKSRLLKRLIAAK